MKPHIDTKRRVALAGGAITEVAYALDSGALLIGTDTTSTYKAAALRLPRMSYQRALSAEGVLSLHPDMLLASADAGPPSVLQQIAAAGVRVIRLGKRHDGDTVRAKISGVPSALALAAPGKTLLQQFDSRLARSACQHRTTTLGTLGQETTSTVHP